GACHRCHPERSEGSSPWAGIPRCARDDRAEGVAIFTHCLTKKLAAEAAPTGRGVRCGYARRRAATGAAMTAPTHAITVPPSRSERFFLLAVVVLALAWSLLVARDRLTWL